MQRVTGRIVVISSLLLDKAAKIKGHGVALVESPVYHGDHGRTRPWQGHYAFSAVLQAHGAKARAAVQYFGQPDIVTVDSDSFEHRLRLGHQFGPGRSVSRRRDGNRDHMAALVVVVVDPCDITIVTLPYALAFPGMAGWHEASPFVGGELADGVGNSFMGTGQCNCPPSPRRCGYCPVRMAALDGVQLGEALRA